MKKTKGEGIELKTIFHHRESLETVLMMSKEIKIRLTKQDKEKLFAVKEFIQGHPGMHLTIDDLSGQSGMYRSKLTAAFKRLYKKSIYRFMLDIKMKHAKKLLLEDELPVKSIAGLCGYSTVQSFSRVFKKYYQVPPSTFKRK